MPGPIHLNSAEALSTHVVIGCSHSWDIRRGERRLKPWHGILIGMRNFTGLCQLRFKVFRELREGFLFVTPKASWRVGLWDCNLG